MKLIIRGKYLVIPVNNSVREKKIIFRDKKGNTVFDFTAPVDTTNPKFYSYIHVERFLRQEFDVEINPTAIFDCTFADALPAKDPENCRRPFVHYTARTGWLSDPNGLFFANGKYHMFYQYNPASTMWGNMHWGHAVSEDLLHWKELEPALYPDKTGAMFSGSAYVDSENASRLRVNYGDPDPIILYYTAAGGMTEQSKEQSFTQCLAFSLDGGETWRKYAGNPIIEHVHAQNRDPKVVWAPEIGRYIMALYLEDNRYALFTSENLFSWNEFQTLTLQNDWNCPDFYPLEGSDGERLWVLTGGQDYYTIGRLTDEGFMPIQNVKPFHYGESCSCAAQTFSFPNSRNCGSLYDRRIRIAYEKMHMPDAPFENQMGIPTEMSLVKVGDLYRLRSVPVPEIASLYDTTVSETKVRLNKPYTMPLDACAYDISFRCAKDTGRYHITLFGISLRVLPDKNKMVVSDLASPVNDLPLSCTGEDITVRIIADTAGIEIFADGGLIYSTAAVPADFGMPYIRFESDENAVIDEITAHALKPIR